MISLTTFLQRLASKHQIFTEPRVLILARKFSTIKMIDGEPECLTSKDESKPKLMNLQTQHGSEETADEENIVVLARSFSPVRETSEEVVWHEELVNDDEDDAVS